MNITSKAINYLKEQQSIKEQARATKKEKATTREYAPNEYGFYTMQQCYILNNMLANGAKVDSDGLFTYKNKDGNTKTHHITNMTAYNASVEAYETLRGLGIKGCVELYEYGDTIRLVRKVDNQYFLTTITDNGITDEPYNGHKQLMQFIKV